MEGEGSKKDHWNEEVHLWDELETQGNGNSQELTSVTLAKTHSSGGYGT